MERERYDDLTLILPTLNEVDTAPLIIKSAIRRFPGISITVVDDGSRDGTVDAVKKVSRHNGSIAIIRRDRKGLPKGLTASIIDGIAASRTRYVAVMDADMQHPIGKLYDVERWLSDGYQLVVCSRSSVRGWPLDRKIISKLLSSLGYLVLIVRGKKRCADIFSGYFGIDKKAVYGIIAKNRGRFVDNGYKFLFDLLKCIDSGGEVKIRDVPYEFGNRKFGASKAGAVQVVALLRAFLT